MKEESQLLDSYLDGELTPDEERRLAEWLAADVEHVRQFVRETSLHRQIRETMLARPYHAFGLSEVKSSEPKESRAPVHWLARRWIKSRARRNFVAEFICHRTSWALAAVAVIICVLVLPGFLPTQGVPELASVTGTEIQILRGGQSVAAEAGLRLQPNDVLRTTGEGKVVISYVPEATRIELEPNSELKLLTWKGGKRFSVRAGKLEATVARQRPFQPMVLVTPQAEARVLGTKFTLTATANVTRLEVAEGRVKLTRTSDDTAVKVGAGHYAVVANGVELAALPGTGRVWREYWTNLVGDNWLHLITHTNYPDRPDGVGYLTNLVSFEMPSDWADNYGLRLRGYIHPPNTGDYTFWIAAKDNASLWLSPDKDPENKVLMANSYGAVSRDWESDTAQKSASVQFVAGRKYYFEVLHKAGVGADHLAVAWQPPGREREIIPIEFLSPFKTDVKEKKR